MQPSRLIRTLAVTLLLSSTPLALQAQTPPGSTLQENTISQDIITLFARAAQLYPTVFSGGSGWYSYSGYTYKYFPAAGIYAGVKDGSVYLMGGVYGNTPSAKGSVTALSTVLQNAITAAASGSSGSSGTTVTADFGNIVAVKTNADLPRLFEELTLESTAVSGATTLVSQLKMERKGVEMIGTVSTERLLVTTTNGASISKADMWVDSQGTIRRLVVNGFDYGTGASADAIGAGMISSMLIAVAAADVATVKAAISTELKNSSALSQKVQKRTIGTAQYETLVLTISASNGAITYLTELTDFGNVSMITRYEVKFTGIGTNSFKVLSVTLR